MILFEICVLAWLCYLSKATTHECLQSPYQENQLGSGLDAGAHTGGFNQAIVTSYKFKCCGEITQWAASITDNDRSTIIFQVWRPAATESTGCYTVVGENIFNSVRSSTGLLIETPSTQLSFQTDDVVGFFISNPRAFRVALNTSQDSETVLLIEDSPNTVCTSDLAVITTTRAAPMISVSMVTTACPISSTAHLPPVEPTVVTVVSVQPHPTATAQPTITTLRNFQPIPQTIQPPPTISGSGVTLEPSGERGDMNLSTTDEPQTDSKLSTGAVIGIVLAGVILHLPCVLILIVVCMGAIRKKRTRELNLTEIQETKTHAENPIKDISVSMELNQAYATSTLQSGDIAQSEEDPTYMYTSVDECRTVNISTDTNTAYVPSGTDMSIKENEAYVPTKATSFDDDNYETMYDYIRGLSKYRVKGGREAPSEEERSLSVSYVIPNLHSQN